MMGIMRNGEAAGGGSDSKAVWAATHAATADHFDDPALSFCDRFGRQSVARAGLTNGHRVLEGCCGTGASALAAAHKGGPATPTVEAEPGTHPLADPEDWWTVVLGTGHRATVEQLDPAAVRRVRAASVGWLREHDVRDLRADVIYAQTHKP